MATARRHVTRAAGNHIEIEINGRTADLFWSSRTCPGLKFTTVTIRKTGRFSRILVTQRDHIRPYVSNWWPPGPCIGYEPRLVNAIAGCL